jgi:hypothetical protein
MAAPTTLTSLKVGTPVTNTYATGNSVVALGGPGSDNTQYTYAITSGLLPPGLSIIPNGLDGGQIYGTPDASTGTPGSNTYTVTVTATDSESIPVTGSVTFTLTVGDGLFMTDTTQAVTTFNTNIGATVTTVTATGGVAPYSYFLNGDGGAYTTNTGIAINEVTGNITTASTTKAGTYMTAVTAEDSAGTPASTTTFPIVVGLKMPNTGQVVITPCSAGGYSSSPCTTYNTMPAPTGGGAGTYTYTLDATSQAFVTANASWLSYAAGVFTITAQPPVVAAFTVTVTAHDSGTLPTDVTTAGTGTVTFSFHIGA